MRANYSVHDIVKFGVISKKLDFSSISTARYIDLEYENFKVSNLQYEDLDFILDIGRFKPDLSGCYVVDDRYYIRDDYIFYEDSYKFAKWKVEISNFDSNDDKILVRLQANIPGSMLVSGFLVDHIINYLLNINGYPVIHGSGVCRDGKSIIFTAQGGCGKSTMAMYFANNNYSILGDNFVIVHDGRALSFLTPFNLFHFNIHNIWNKLSTETKFNFYLKYLIFKLSGLNITTKINIRSIFPVADMAKIDKILFLKPCNRKFSLEQINKEELLNCILANQMLDSINFLRCMLEYSYVFPESTLACYWAMYRDNLEKSISNKTAIFKVNVPKNAINASKYIYEWVKKNA